jgi:hypothetical protein
MRCVRASTFSSFAAPSARFQAKETTMLSKSVFFVTCLLIANGAMGQTGQIEITAPWARATPGHAENGAAYLTIVSPTADRLPRPRPRLRRRSSCTRCQWREGS